MSRKHAVRAILLALVLPVFAIAQEAQEEKREGIEEATSRAAASFTTADTLDPKDFAKPALAPRAGQTKKLLAVREAVGDSAKELEKALQSGAIGTVKRYLPAKEPAGLGSTSTGDAKLDALVTSAATKYGLDPHLIVAVMRQESGFNARAVSPKGARGLMQLMPATAQRFGVRDILDPAQNIDGGAQYLRFLLETFNGDVELALAGYNAGENAVARYGNRVPPYRETKDYVQRISAHYSRLRSGAGLSGQPAEKRNDPELMSGARTLTQY